MSVPKTSPACEKNVDVLGAYITNGLVKDQHMVQKQEVTPALCLVTPAKQNSQLCLFSVMSTQREGQKAA